MEPKYDSAHIESELQKQWLSEGVYKADISKKPVYSVDTPPPTVSGSLHIGHVFSYTQTDIAARYKRMSGFSVVYPFGFDDNGLPTERYIEKKRGVKAERMARSEFVQICLQETKEVERGFQNLWQRLGFSVDWSLEYSTISKETQALSQESFLRLYEKGFVYRRYEPAPYCTTCCTSVAQAELDDAQQETFFNDIPFMLPDGAQLIISTTRPEFLPACVALLYHPDDERYKKYAGQKARVPLFDKEVVISADQDVDPEKGTGLVMCCIFGDKQDIVWAKRLNIAYESEQILGLNGKFTQKAGMLADLTPLQARQKIVEALKESALLLAQRPVTNVVNVHERCKKNIEYVALAQWFVKILPYKKDILRYAEKITWHPEFMKSRFVNWVESLSWDWCISRQRFFGIPFPVWHCKACSAVLVPPLSALPIDPRETNYFTQCSHCSSGDIVPDIDVMDTWNTSSIAPQIVASLLVKGSVFEKESVAQLLPMGMRPQAHDIIRTWAFYTIVKSWMHYGDIVPWHEVVISGHVLSDAKEKLSKSKENSKMAPESLIQTHSADAIRYWTASARLGHDVAFSENQLRIGAKLITKLWNAFRFTAEHQALLDDPQPSELGVVNEWILHEYSALLKNYKQYHETYEAGLALQAVEQFFWTSWCDNYLEIIKNQLFNPTLYPTWQVAATRWTLGQISFGILQLFAPYLVHVTEKIYQELYRAQIKLLSIHCSQFPKSKFIFEKSSSSMQLVLMLISIVRRLKTERQLSLKTPVVKLTLYGSEEQLAAIKSVEQIICGVTHVQAIVYTSPVENVETNMFLQDSDYCMVISF